MRHLAHNLRWLFDVELVGIGGCRGGGSGSEGREARHDVGEEREGSGVGIHGGVNWMTEKARVGVCEIGIISNQFNEALRISRLALVTRKSYIGQCGSK